MITVLETSEESLAGADLVFCSATAEASRYWGPRIAAAGGVLIDDGSAFRMEPNVPLVIPEVNGDDLEWHEGIISIPNCTTTPLAVALHALREVAPLRRVTAATYQAVSGSGTAAVEELALQLRAYGRGGPVPEPQEYPHQIALNVLPHVDDFTEDGYTREELKMRNETRKILHLPELAFSSTCVRVPTMVGHAEAVHAEFDGPVPLEALREAIEAQDWPRAARRARRGALPDAAQHRGRRPRLRRTAAHRHLGRARRRLLVRDGQPAQGCGDQRDPDRRGVDPPRQTPGARAIRDRQADALRPSRQAEPGGGVP